MRLATAKILDNTEAVALTTHRTITTAMHGKLRPVSAAIDVKAVANTEIALGGLAADNFCLENIVFRITTVGGAALNGNTTVSIGTTNGGAEIAAAAPLTGLIALDSTFRVSFVGLMPTMLANASIFVNVTIADTSAGTGTMVAYVEGDTF